MTSPDDGITAPGSSAGRRTILLIEDDASFAVAVTRLLRGYDVTVMTSVSDALVVLLAGGHYDAIVSDLMMPHMSGIDLYERLVEHRPDLVDRIVFMTGGAFTEEAKAFLDRVPNPCLDKPVHAETLRRVIQLLVK